MEKRDEVEEDAILLCTEKITKINLQIFTIIAVVMNKMEKEEEEKVT
jgi:hypothetical protein